MAPCFTSSVPPPVCVQARHHVLHFLCPPLCVQAWHHVLRRPRGDGEGAHVPEQRHLLLGGHDVGVHHGAHTVCAARGRAAILRATFGTCGRRATGLRRRLQDVVAPVLPPPAPLLPPPAPRRHLLLLVSGPHVTPRLAQHHAVPGWPPSLWASRGLRGPYRV